MRKFLFIILLILMVVVPAIVSAQAEDNPEPQEQEQEQTQEVSNENNKVTVEVTLLEQSALNKSVPIEVKFRTNFDTDNAEIVWDYPSQIELVTRHERFVEAKANETYVYRAIIRPQSEGTFSITANIVAWQYNTNYTGSASTSVTFTENLITDPISPSYTVMTIVKLLIILVLLGIGGFFGVRALKKFKTTFFKWFNPPE